MTAPGLPLCLLCARERTEEVVRRPFREGTPCLQRKEMLGAPRGLKTQHSTSVWHAIGYRVTQDCFKATHICLPAPFAWNSPLPSLRCCSTFRSQLAWHPLKEVLPAYSISFSNTPHRGVHSPITTGKLGWLSTP